MRVRESEREIDRGNESKRERQRQREREIEREKEGHLWSPPSFSSPCFLLPVIVPISLPPCYLSLHPLIILSYMLIFLQQYLPMDHYKYVP